MSRISLRQIVTYAAAAGVLLLARPYWPTYIAGCGLALIGIFVRVWGCGHLRKNQDVVTSGPYAYVKNPLYVGTFLLAVGGLLAAGSMRMPALLLWAALGPLYVLLWFGYYMPKKKRIEGERLRKHFGAAYDAYDRAVPAFVPSLSRYPQGSRARWSWGTFRSNHELGLDALLVLLFVAMPFSRQWLGWS